MTTAARPTFEPARGGTGKGEGDLGALSKQYSSRDLPGHTKLKYRQHGQGTREELKSKDFRRELEEKELSAARHKREGKRDAKELGDNESEKSGGKEKKKPRVESLKAASLDADDSLSEEEETGSEDSDEDDTAELLAELNRIKRERAQEEARKEAEKQAWQENVRMEKILNGNPLLASHKNNFQVKRRWDEDVVFKNCTRGEPNKNENFINDTLRSEFHKRFMERYIK